MYWQLSTQSRHSTELAGVQVKREFASVASPVEVVETEGPVRVIRPDVFGKPDDFAHVQREVGEIVDCVAHHRRILGRGGWVRDWVEAVVWEAGCNLLMERWST
jgi:hypothetical protein